MELVAARHDLHSHTGESERKQMWLMACLKAPQLGD